MVREVCAMYENSTLQVMKEVRGETGIIFEAKEDKSQTSFKLFQLLGFKDYLRPQSLEERTKLVNEKPNNNTMAIF